MSAVWFSPKTRCAELEEASEQNGSCSYLVTGNDKDQRATIHSNKAETINKRHKRACPCLPREDDCTPGCILPLQPNTKITHWLVFFTMSRFDTPKCKALKIPYSRSLVKINLLYIQTCTVLNEHRFCTYWANNPTYIRGASCDLELWQSSESGLKEFFTPKMISRETWFSRTPPRWMKQYFSLNPDYFKQFWSNSCHVDE